MQLSTLPADVQALDAPDYVAVVIEWNDDGEVRSLVSQRRVPHGPRMSRTLATALGALGAIALTTIGLRLLRSA